MKQNNNVKNTGFGTACFVLGLLGLLTFFIPVLILPILGIIFFFVQKKKGGTNGLSVAGLVMSIIGLLIQILVLISVLSVLIMTSQAIELQEKTLEVGRQSQEKITSEAEVLQIYAEGAENSILDANEDKIRVAVRLGAGSQAIKLSDMIIKLDVSEGYQTLTYGNLPSVENFGVVYLINGTQHVDGYLNPGDMAEIIFLSEFNLDVSQSGTIRLVAKNGAVKPIMFTIPSNSLEGNFVLFP